MTAFVACQDYKGIYRPRRPRDGTLFQILSENYAAFREDYQPEEHKDWGPCRPVVEKSVEAFLECGLPEHGLARVRCPSCRDEYLLPFSCQIRGLCVSCGAKRSSAWGRWAVEEVSQEVQHRHVTVSVPKILRPCFKYQRGLLTEFSRWVYECILELTSTLATEKVRPGCLSVVHSAGNLLNANPHVHFLTTSGAFDEATGTQFYVLPEKFWGKLEEMVRRKVLTELRRRKLISEERMRMLLSWRHSGFSVFVGDPIYPENRKGLERLACYMRRLHVSESRLVYDRENGRVIVSSGKAPHPKFKANFRVLDVNEFLAELTTLIPQTYQHESLAYGEYSSAAMGRRRKQDGLEPLTIRELNRKQARSAWRELMKRIYEVDPLICRACGDEMEVVAAITDEKVLRRILEHLGLWSEPGPVLAKPRAPPEQSAIRPDEDPQDTDVDDVSQVPPWWDEDEAYSQLPPEDAA